MPSYCTIYIYSAPYKIILCSMISYCAMWVYIASCGKNIASYKLTLSFDSYSAIWSYFTSNDVILALMIFCYIICISCHTFPSTL